LVLEGLESLTAPVFDMDSRDALKVLILADRAVKNFVEDTRSDELFLDYDKQFEDLKQTFESVSTGYKSFVITRSRTKDTGIQGILLCSSKIQ